MKHQQSSTITGQKLLFGQRQLIHVPAPVTLSRNVSAVPPPHRCFNLSLNPLGSDACADVAKALASHPGVAEVDLSGTHADDASVEGLCRALQSNSALRVLKLGGN